MLKRNFLVLLTAAALVLAISGCEDILGTDENAQQDENGDQGTPQSEITSQEVSEADAQAALEFWNEDRLAQAEPYPVGVDVGVDGDPPATTEPEIDGSELDTVEVEGQLPQVDDILLPDPGGGGDVATVTPQQSNTNSQIVSQTAYPYSAIGKVFFKKDSGWFTCSGAVIASENKSVVWTAGHCVAEQGNEDWHENWIFIPAYQDSSEPYGRYAARTKATFVGWYSGGNRNYDLGAVVVERKDEQPIANRTGSLGWMFNASRDQDWQEFGYATAGPIYNGRNLNRCGNPYDGADGVGSNPGPRTSTTDCNMTGGASGGPWLVGTADDCPSCYINSVTSWGWWRGTWNKSVQLAGPYHGNAAQSLLQFAENL
jgi:V8-like Glu-specific endopeptidase